MVNIMCESKLASPVKRAIKKTAKTALKVEGIKADVAVLVTDDENIHKMNKQFRDKDMPTDVLSFPSDEPGFLGDIAISVERAKAQAEEYGHSLEREAAFLTAHAMLHLVGLEHKEKKEEERMRARQREILRKSGYGI